ncbi:MAG: hypothetical protein ACR2P1_21210 [Pseudomonadales bacterium]
MNIKLIAAVTLVIALVAGYLIVNKYSSPTGDGPRDVAELRSTESSVENSSIPSHYPEDVSNNTNGNENNHLVDLAPQKVDNRSQGPTWPEGVEDLILDYFSQLEGFEFTSITSVQCQIQTCEIVFSGKNPNPTVVDEFSEVTRGLYQPPLNAQQGSIGTREIAPGAREFVINISNVPYVKKTGSE